MNLQPCIEVFIFWLIKGWASIGPCPTTRLPGKEVQSGLARPIDLEVVGKPDSEALEIGVNERGEDEIREDGIVANEVGVDEVGADDAESIDP